MGKIVTVVNFECNANDLPLYVEVLDIHSDGRYLLHAYVELDCQTGILVATTNPGIGRTSFVIPDEVRYGYVRWFTVRNTLTTSEINALLDKITSLAQRVLDGYYTEDEIDDHHKIVGKLNDDARLAEDGIDKLCEQTLREYPTLQPCYAYEWLSKFMEELLFRDADEPVSKFADTLDLLMSRIAAGEPISQIVDELRDATISEGVYLICPACPFPTSLESALQQLWQEFRVMYVDDDNAVA